MSLIKELLKVKATTSNFLDFAKKIIATNKTLLVPDETAECDDIQLFLLCMGALLSLSGVEENYEEILDRLSFKELAPASHAFVKRLDRVLSNRHDVELPQIVSLLGVLNGSLRMGVRPNHRNFYANTISSGDLIKADPFWHELSCVISRYVLDAVTDDYKCETTVRVRGKRIRATRLYTELNTRKKWIVETFIRTLNPRRNKFEVMSLTAVVAALTFSIESVSMWFAFVRNEWP